MKTPELTARSEHYDEMEIEDMVFLVNPIGESSKIFVVHQAAQRLLRKDIVQAMKKNIREVESMDLEDLYSLVEQHSVEVEDKLFKIISEEYYAGQEQENKVPVFDFEIN